MQCGTIQAFRTLAAVIGAVAMIAMANADDISRVVFNLAENAIKYNVTGGSVDILLSQDE